MANPDRDFDKTHLSIDTAAERVMFHRDYIAHLFRWTHVIKHLYKQKNYLNARILDIGCGKEVPLARALYSNKLSGAKYCGVDLNKLQMPEMLVKAVENKKLEVTLLSTDASTLTADMLPWQPNIITSFEAWEHMHPEAALRTFKNAYDLLADDGIMFFSTPCWNGKAAANHINETTYEAMGFILQNIGFAITDVFGTFASISDYKPYMDYALEPFYDRLREYYDTNMLSAIIAPLFPSHSRNAMWVCAKHGVDIKTFPEPSNKWSQHPDWEKLNA